MVLDDNEILTISERIPDISRLGLLLGYEASEVDAFEQQNNVDLTKRRGTYAMLKKWYAKDGSTKDKLVEALRGAGLGKLADRVHKGEFKEERQPDHRGAAASDRTSEESIQRGKKADVETPAAESTSMDKEDIDDKVLGDIASDIGDNFKMKRLGLELGFKSATVDGYVVSNRADGIITCKGTLKMLEDWKCNTPVSTRRSQLKRALERSSLAGIADTYFGEEAVRKQALTQPAHRVPHKSCDEQDNQPRATYHSEGSSTFSNTGHIGNFNISGPQVNINSPQTVTQGDVNITDSKDKMKKAEAAGGESTFSTKRQKTHAH